jgi:acetolactate synthase-1/3 small subunit
MIIEVTGDQTKLDSLLELLKPFGITDISRSGRLAINRGSLEMQNFNPVQPSRRTRTRKNARNQDELGW